MKIPLLIKRSLAYTIDCIIIFFYFIVTQTLLFIYIRQQIGIDEKWFANGFYTEAYVLLTVSIPAWLYFTYFDSKLAKSSFGKRIFRIYLTNTDDNKLSFSKNFIRTLLKLLPWEIAHLTNNIPVPIMYEENPEFRIGFILSGLLLLLYVLITFASNGRMALYDKLLKTQVTGDKLLR